MQKINSNSHALVILFLGFAVLAGGLIRLVAVLFTDFPINDGGLFYVMVQDLLKSNLHMPAITSYNNLDIPFAYPPLALYLASFFASAGIDLINIFRWLPLIFSLLTIPAFYWLARILVHDDILAALATVIFALLPRSFEWLIMGGGLPRAPATLLYLIFIGLLLLVFRDKQKNAIVPALLIGSLVVLTHPERGLHAATSGVFFWLYYDRSRKGFSRAVTIGLGVLAISALWWGPIISAGGLAPFYRAMSAGGNRLLFWSPMLFLNFTDESIPLVAIFSAIGFIYMLSRRDWFLPIWITITFLVDPRSAPQIVSAQASLLAALAIYHVLLPGLTGEEKFDWENFITNGTCKAAIGWVLVLLVINAYQVSNSLSTEYTLSHDDRSAMEWVRQNTPENSFFMTYTHIEHPALSPVLEWFPALTARTNISTFQGREWLAGEESYDAYWENLDQWRQCLHQDLKCLSTWLNGTTLEVDYIYFSLGDERQNNSLAESMRHEVGITLAYQNGSVLIFKVHE